ncbi:MAG: DUF5667 domain-containing protein [bacterium]|nr:DUF5667 domain-containing protein [bacterium]
MKKNVILSLVISFFVAFFATSFVFAQTPELISADEDAIGTVTDDGSPAEMLAQDETAEQILAGLDNVEEKLKGVEIGDIASVPSGFGLWLRDWRERISTVLTFDPVKKAEKRLVYAEERMKIAEKILEESTNPNALKKAGKMIEVAQKHIDQIQERKDNWETKQTERVEKLKSNLTTHQLRRDHAMERIEEKIPEESREKFSQMRERMLEKGFNLIGDIDDTEVSEKIFEHLISVRSRIESQVGAVKQYSREKKELLDNDELSSEEIHEKIQILWEERKIKLQEIRYDFRERQENVKRKSNESREQAEKTLERIKEAREILKEKNELIKDRVEELKKLREEGVVGEELKDRMEGLREAHEEIIENFQERKAEVMEGQTIFSDAMHRANALKDRARIYNERLENELNQ